MIRIPDELFESGERSEGSARPVFASQLAEARQAAALTRAGAKSSVALHDLDRAVDESTADPATWADNFLAEAQRLRDDHLATLPGPGLGEAFARDFDDLAAAKLAIIRRRAAAREVEDARAQLDETLDAYAGFAVEASSEVEARIVHDQAGDSIARMEQAGYLRAGEADELRQSYAVRQDTARLDRLMEANPGAAAQALGDPVQFATLEPDARLRLRDRAQIRAEDQQRAAAAAASSERKGRIAGLMVRLDADDADRADIMQAVSEGWLQSAERDRALALWDHRRAEIRQRTDAIGRVAAALADEGDPLDARDPRDRAAIDFHFDDAKAAWLATGLSEEQLLPLTTDYVGAVGILPSGVRRDIAGAFRTGDPQARIRTADLIEQLPPEVLEDIPQRDVAEALLIRSLVEGGWPRDQAPDRAAALLTGTTERTDRFASSDREAFTQFLDGLSNDGRLRPDQRIVLAAHVVPQQQGTRDTAPLPIPPETVAGLDDGGPRYPSGIDEGDARDAGGIAHIEGENITPGVPIASGAQEDTTQTAGGEEPAQAGASGEAKEKASNPRNPAMEDVANEILAIQQGTSPIVQGWDGKYNYERASDDEQFFFGEFGRTRDPDKFVVLIDPGTGQPTVWLRSPEMNESGAVRGGRLLGLSLLTDPIRFGRAAKVAQSAQRAAQADPPPAAANAPKEKPGVEPAGGSSKASRADIELPPDIVEAQHRSREIPSTDTINSPERIRQRGHWAKELYGKGAAKKERQADIVMGPPASGKSSQVAEPLAKERGALIVDSDLAKERIPEYEGGIGAAAVHSESTAVRAQVFDAATKNGDNIILPIVGANETDVRAVIGKLRDFGYDIRLHYVDLPIAKAVERSIDRYRESGRFVDPDYIKSVGDNPRRNFERLKSEGGLGGFYEYSTDVPQGQPAKKVR